MWACLPLRQYTSNCCEAPLVKTYLRGGDPKDMPGVQLVQSFFGLLELYPKVQRHRSELEMYMSILDQKDYADAQHKQAGMI